MKDSANIAAVPWHQRLRQARRRAGLTQAALAAEVGCAQSAISMMEGGRWSALARPTVEKIAERLGVALPTGQEVSVTGMAAEPGRTRVCPSADCPSNWPYVVDGITRFLPRPVTAVGLYCPLCGEVLVSACPGCGSPLASSAACCVFCGEAYVFPPAQPPVDPTEWIAEKQRLCERLAGWRESCSEVSV